MRLDGKVAIVTGAGSERGIGRAIAVGFAREGARVAVADIDKAAAASTTDAISKASGQALPVEVDVSDRSQIRQAMAATVEAFGRIDILVNNAGFCTFRPFLDIDDALWDQTMAVNLKGYFICGQEAARRMIEQGGGGKIINISSISADESGEEKVHYCVSKAGIKSLTLGMALELARYHINVNAIAPGIIDTDIIKQPHIQKLVEYEREQSSIPWGRMGRGEDLAGAAVFLASDEAEYITGATILVDGGLSAGSLLPPSQE